MNIKSLLSIFILLLTNEKEISKSHSSEWQWHTGSGDITFNKITGRISWKFRSEESRNKSESRREDKAIETKRK